MIAAPERGAGSIKTKEGPGRRQPTGPKTKSACRHSISAPALQNQACSTLDSWQRRNAYGFGNVVTSTTTPDDPERRQQLRAAGARAGHVLEQMGKLLRYWGLKHPPPERQEAWLRIGAAQYNAIRASKPRWTFGFNRWVRHYLPEIWRTWTPERLDALARKVRREGTYYPPEVIGAMIGADREAYLVLALSDIWPAGMTAGERERDRLDARNARERASNLATGKVKRPHAQSVTRRQPWKELGISERTYWRWAKSGKVPASA